MEIEVQPSSDVPFFMSVLSNKDVLKGIVDDGHMTVHEEVLTAAVNDGRNIFLEAKVDGKKAGFFALFYSSPGTYDVHTNLLPEFWGKPAIQCAKAGMAWAFTHGVKRVTTYCFSVHKAAILFTRLCGFRKIADVEHDFTVGGNKVRRFTFEITA